MYEDLVVRDELYRLTDKKFQLALLLCKRIQQLDLGHPKAIDTLKQNYLEVVIDEVRENALLFKVTDPFGVTITNEETADQVDGEGAVEQEVVG